MHAQRIATLMPARHALLAGVALLALGLKPAAAFEYQVGDRGGRPNSDNAISGNPA